MPKIMLHDEAARAALGRGVAKLAKAVRGGTLGPKGMNAIMDRPIGTPILSRDGVSIASEIELECPFENMGAQVLREVSARTNEVAGDGTTTATVLADFLVQEGLKCLAAGANPVELVEGLELAVTETITALRRSARPLQGPAGLRAVASIAANDTALGAMVGEAFERAGNHGIVAVEFGNTVETTLEIVEGMAFDRGYLSHHMVTDVAKMQVVLDNPCIILTDLKLQAGEQLAGVISLIEKSGRPLLIIAEEVAPSVIMQLLAHREKSNFKVAAIHPPEFGHWRKAMLEDIAITTGGFRPLALCQGFAARSQRHPRPCAGAGDPRHLRLPAQPARHADRRAGAAEFAAWHLRLHGSARLQPQQPVADGDHAGDRLCGRRRGGGDREHRTPPGNGQEPHAGRARRRAGNRLHRAVDDDLARRRFPAHPVHGRHDRPAVPGIRRQHRCRRSALRRGGADAYADAVRARLGQRPARQSAVARVRRRLQPFPRFLRHHPACQHAPSRRDAAAVAGGAGRDALAGRPGQAGLHPARRFRDGFRQRAVPGRHPLRGTVPAPAAARRHRAEAPRMFVEWVLSDEAQGFLAGTLGKGSAMKDVRSKFKEFQVKPDYVVNPKLGANLQSYIQDFRKIMGAP